MERLVVLATGWATRTSETCEKASLGKALNLYLNHTHSGSKEGRGYSPVISPDWYYDTYESSYAYSVVVYSYPTLHPKPRELSSKAESCLRDQRYPQAVRVCEFTDPDERSLTRVLI